MKELELIIKEGEGQFVEFKRGMTDISSEIVAFANSSGGRLYIGVNDDGTIHGIKIDNTLKSQIHDIVRNCDPSLTVSLKQLSLNGKDILEIDVKEGTNKPYQCKGGFYLRQGANSQKMTRNEIVDLIMTIHGRAFDIQPNSEFNIKKHFDMEKFSNYLVLAGLDVKVKKEILLNSLDVMKSGQMTNAGVLFFAKEPQKFFRNSFFTCALFKGKERTDVIDRKDIKGGLFEIVEDVMKFVEKNTKVAYRFTGKARRENVFEYPLKAIREAVINAVMHKYYPDPGHNNMLYIYSDRIEIEDFWIKPKDFKIGETVYRGNTLISDLFARIEMGERLGTGIKRIKEECKAASTPMPSITVRENYFYITFKPSVNYLKLAGAGTPEKVLGSVPRETAQKTTQKILVMVKENPAITRRELAEKIGLTADGIKFSLTKLKKKGIIKRVGPDKGGHWEVNE